MANPSQAVLTVGQDRRLRRTAKPVFGEWLRDKKYPLAWHILRKLFTACSFLKGKMCLVIDERFALPINPYESYADEDLVALTELDGKGCRTDQALDEAQNKADKESAAKMLVNGLTAIVAGLVVCVIVLALLVAYGRV